LLEFDACGPPKSPLTSYDSSVCPAAAANSNRNANQSQIRPSGRLGDCRSVVDPGRIRRNCWQHAVWRGQSGWAVPCAAASYRCRRQDCRTATHTQGRAPSSSNVTHYRHDEAVLCDHPITPAVACLNSPAGRLSSRPITPTCYKSSAINNRLGAFYSVNERPNRTTTHDNSTCFILATHRATPPIVIYLISGPIKEEIQIDD